VNNIKMDVREVEPGNCGLRIGLVEGYCENNMYLRVV
jgi:hypothetical protein